MRNKRIFSAAALMLLFGLFSWNAFSQKNAATDVKTTLESADKDFYEKSFARALNQYEELLKNPASELQADEIKLKKGICLFYLNKFEEAKKIFTDDILLRHSGSKLSASAHLYLGMALFKINRWNQTDKIISELDTAISELKKFGDEKTKETDLTEAIFLIADLENQKWTNDYSENKPEKNSAIKRLEAVKDATKNEESLARALITQASYTLAYRYYQYKNKPYDKEQTTSEAIAFYREAIKKYPKTNLAVEAQFQIANTFKADERFVEALKEYEELLKLFPESGYADRAKSEIKEITAVTITASVDRVFNPTEIPFLHITSRNIPKVFFDVDKIDLFDMLKTVKSLYEPGDYKKGEKIKSFTKDTEKSDEHKWYSTEIKLDKLPKGAYLVHAYSQGVESVVLVLVTDIALITKRYNDNILTFLCNAKNGAPAEHAEIMIMYDFNWTQYGNPSPLTQRIKKASAIAPVAENTKVKYEYSSMSLNKTDVKGMLIWTLEKKDLKDNRLIVIGKQDEDYAICNQFSFFKNRQLLNNLNNFLYFYTDRPVYRPEQKAFFKGILRGEKDGQYTNSEGINVKVTIRDPQGKELQKYDFLTNEYGTFNGDYIIPAKAPLGNYSATCETANNRFYFNFAVEEYKKPEFEVSLEAAAAEMRLGDEADIVGSADYYFGAPVKNAVVEWTVYRSPDYYFWQSPLDNYVDWLPDAQNNKSSDRFCGYYYYYQEFILKGESFTDDNGKFHVYFKSQKKYEKLDGLDEYTQNYLKKNGERWNYTIEAKVTDESRRQISGSLNVKITEKAFFAFLSAQKGIFQPGETAKIKVFTKNANDKPVISNGKIYIRKAKYDEAIKDYAFTEIIAEEIKTGDDGNFIFKWVPDSEGYFKIAYETMDKYENKIIGEHWLWVCSDRFSGGNYLCKNIEIITDRKLYKPGETAQILINTEFPQASILFTIETDEEILKSEIFSLDGYSKMLSVKIDDSFSPNVFIKALMIRDYRVMQDSAEIKVPPTKKILDVKIEGEKEKYSPGEEAEFTATVKDESGAPTQAEVSLGFADEAIYYIAEDTTEDIRRFFYGKMRNDSIGLVTSYEFYSGDSDKKAGTYKMKRDAIAQGDIMAMKEVASTPAPAALSAEKGGVLGMGVKYADNSFAKARVRKDFRDLAFWSASKSTDKNGKVKIKVKFPDSLTSWRINVKAVTKDTLVGTLTDKATVAKNIIVRLEAPRFFVERDEPVVSAIVHNYLKTAKNIKTTIECEGLSIADSGKEATINIPPDSSKRVDFPLSVPSSRQTEAKIKVAALADVESDAVEMKFPVFPHGIEKFIARSGSLGKLNSKEEILNLPKKQLFSKASLEIEVSPTIATAIADALEYLASYPYGCVEQTMSRFIPCSVTARTLQELGIPNEKIKEKLPAMIDVGLKRIYDFQQSNGGWGWWKYDTGNPYMTAYVYYGLTLALTADIKVEPEVMKRAEKYLLTQLKDPNIDLNTKTFMLFALSGKKLTDENALLEVWEMREKINDYSRGMLAAAMYKLGRKEMAQTLIRNLENFARVDKANQTVSWVKDGGYYFWYDDGVEATAMALQAFTLIDPDHQWNPMIAKWLVNNRRGGKWKSTKDTAVAILALNKYISAKKEIPESQSLKVFFGDKLLKEFEISKDNIWKFDGKIVLADSEIPEGKIPVRIEKQGGEEAYYTIYLKYFTSEEDIKGSGNEVFVNREYFKIIKKVSPNKEEIEEKFPIKNGDQIKTGDEIKVVIKINAKNNYEYLMFEDMKPAACEPVQLRSGYTYANGLCSNMELRDEKVVFFITSLRQGDYEIGYNMKVVTPGKFHVMPTSAAAMYVPEIRSTSDEFRLQSAD